MAEWSKNKVEPSAINGGNEFVKGDNLAVNELNAIVNNSFFASERAESAEQKVNSFVEEEGKTAVTIEGEVQSRWSADFVEAERQKSKNLLVYPYTGEVYQYGVTFTDNGDGSFTINGKQTDTTANSYHYMETDDTFKLSAGTYTLKAFADTAVTGWNVVLYDGTTYHEVSSPNITRTITLNEDKYCRVYIQVPKASTTTFNNFVVKPILVKGTEVGEWQPYNGAITHNGDAPVLFAEAERQKSKNLWAYGDVSGTKWKDINLEKPLPIGTYMMSFVAESVDTDSSKCLIEFYDENGTYISGNSVERNTRENKRKTFTVPVGRISFYASTSFAGGTNDTFTFSNIQIEEGKVATDYQPYNGAIVHEKDIANFSAGITDVVYDYSDTSKQSINGTAYTNGLMFGYEYDIDLNKYKKIILTISAGSKSHRVLCEIPILSQGTNMGSFVGIAYVISSRTLIFGSETYDTDDKVLYLYDCYTSTIGVSDGVTSYNNSTSYTVTKIEGVY